MTAKEERKYVRVYYEIIDDQRFEGVFGRDDYLATWLRLLLVADAMWPAPAPLPRSARVTSVAALSKAGLVDLLPHEMFRIHGLDPERERRMREQQNGGHVRAATGARGPDGRYLRTPPLDTTAGAPPEDQPGIPAIQLSQAKQSKDEQRLAEQGAREAGPVNGHEDRLDGPMAYQEVTLRYPSLNSNLHEWTVRLAEEFGAAAFQAALAMEFTINRSGKDLMSRTESRLAQNADEVRAEFQRDRARDRAATRAERTARELREVREKEARIAVEPMKPLSELMPNLRIGTRPPGKPS